MYEWQIASFNPDNYDDYIVSYTYDIDEALVTLSKYKMLNPTWNNFIR